MTATSVELCWGRRFCGPPRAANGGYACGTIAALLGGTTEVTLRKPLPLGRALAARHDGGAVVVLDGGTVLAEARPAAGAVPLAAPAVTARQARAVAGTSRYYADPVFPGCFVCGTDRGPGDGLRIFPGPVPGRGVWAAPWTPDASITGPGGVVAAEFVWAALDCPSGLAAAEAAALPPGTAAVLGRMTARMGALPRAGDQCRVVAWPGQREGRKLGAASALLGPGGAVLAAATAVWLTVAYPVHPPAAGASL